MAHVTFIHGIANKPKPDVLLDIWLRNLAQGEGGINLGGEGITSSMVYWADVLYAEPDANVAAYESQTEQTPRATDGSASARTPVAGDVEEAAFLTGLAVKIGGTLAAAEAVEAIPASRGVEGSPYERVPLPWPIKKVFLETFLRDVHHYLFNVSFSPRPGTTYRVQDEIRARFITALSKVPATSKPHIVVSHSLGTVITYDCLKRLGDCAAVDALVTIGSPLGLDEIQDKLVPGWSRLNGFPGDKVSGRWVNFFDRLDPVAGFDPFLSNDYEQDGKARLEDFEVSNPGAWRHSVVKYLRAPRLHQALAEILDL